MLNAEESVFVSWNRDSIRIVSAATYKSPSRSTAYMKRRRAFEQVNSCIPLSPGFASNSSSS